MNKEIFGKKGKIAALKTMVNEEKGIETMERLKIVISILMANTSASFFSQLRKASCGKVAMKEAFKKE